MKIERRDPPRRFRTGIRDDVTMSDCANIALGPDEQVTFVTESGAEYDVARKSWGFYATPSLNGRLAGFGLRPVLVVNTLGRHFVLLVEDGSEDDFAAYLHSESLRVVCRLDDPEALATLGREGKP
ncbi:hypothetical protein GGQ74_000728 [Desulfobaculum xiamenense]|uniref:Uncharacterized protein n=1 Tax=Desulfobaculum xiamenense TaxID=995050 RepID=A0A846QFI2_9BACT|nr:hypothetical protein [Desulfobaculum xiamenense]NJB67088.1 hypothetical protein [Desulfobaculum xiamenense]